MLNLEWVPLTLPYMYFEDALATNAANNLVFGEIKEVDYGVWLVWLVWVKWVVCVVWMVWADWVV